LPDNLFLLLDPDILKQFDLGPQINFMLQVSPDIHNSLAYLDVADLRTLMAL